MGGMGYTTHTNTNDGTSAKMSWTGLQILITGEYCSFRLFNATYNSIFSLPSRFLEITVDRRLVTQGSRVFSYQFPVSLYKTPLVKRSATLCYKMSFSLIYRTFNVTRNITQPFRVNNCLGTDNAGINFVHIRNLLPPSPIELSAM